MRKATRSYSTPTAKPISMIDSIAAGADRVAWASRKQEIPGEARITTATAGAQKRSNNQPPTSRPDSADRPIREVS